MYALVHYLLHISDVSEETKNFTFCPAWLYYQRTPLDLLEVVSSIQNHYRISFIHLRHHRVFVFIDFEPQTIENTEISKRSIQ